MCSFLPANANLSGSLTLLSMNGSNCKEFPGTQFLVETDAQVSGEGEQSPWEQWTLSFFLQMLRGPESSLLTAPRALHHCSPHRSLSSRGSGSLSPAMCLQGADLPQPCPVPIECGHSGPATCKALTLQLCLVLQVPLSLQMDILLQAFSLDEVLP
jgi:hypothetical protein